jgi:hypothetical protein
VIVHLEGVLVRPILRRIPVTKITRRAARQRASIRKYRVLKPPNLSFPWKRELRVFASRLIVLELWC